MFYNNPKFQEKYYDFVSGIFAFNKVLKIIPVNFQKTLWKPIWDQKSSFILDLLSEIIQAVFGSITPLILGYAIYNQSISTILIFGFAYLGIELMNRTLHRVRAIYTTQAGNSINYFAYRFFLTVDPVYHATKSSGQIVSKVERASKSYVQMINFFLEDAVNIIISFVTIIIVLASFNYKLGLISGFAFIVLACINALLSFVNSKSLIKKLIRAQDQKSIVNTENLSQNALIRSSFATTEQDHKMLKFTKKLMVESSIVWFGSGISITINRVLFLISTMILSFTILDLVKNSEMTAVTAVALLVTFLSASGAVLTVGNVIRNITEKYFEIIDLWDFIRGFGKQTYPVLEEEDKV